MSFLNMFVSFVYEHDISMSHVIADIAIRRHGADLAHHRDGRTVGVGAFAVWGMLGGHRRGRARRVFWEKCSSVTQKASAEGPPAHVRPSQNVQ